MDARLVERLTELASAVGSSALENESRDLAVRVAEGRFYLACVGQFKRGKSTILDALLGETVLPIGVVPVTAVPTVVRYGPQRIARVRIGDLGWRQIDIDSVEQYVSEAENPSNAKNVSAIEVFLPDPLLQKGLCFVDTPGIGSVFEVNTKATHDFVPRVDAALVVLGADPPLTGEEMLLIQEISRHVDSLLFVINKADRLTLEELKSGKAFTTRILAARLHRDFDIYEVSAKSELDTRGGDWEWPLFQQALDRLVSESGRVLPRKAQRRAAQRLVKRIEGAIEERRETLLMPLEKAEHRLETLTSFISSVRQSLLDLDQLLRAEQGRASVALSARRDEFLVTNLPASQELLVERLSGGPEQGTAFRARAIDVALAIARDRLIPWLAAEQDLAEAEYARIVARFNSVVDQYLQKLGASGVQQLAHIGDTPFESGNLTAPSQFYFNKLLPVGLPASPFRVLGDLVLGAVCHRTPIYRDASRFLTRVTETNAHRVESDLNHRLGVARRELENAVKRRLDVVLEAAKETLDRTRRIKAAGEDAVGTELVRLENLRKQAIGISRELV